jgi:hypothetical protein
MKLNFRVMIHDGLFPDPFQRRHCENPWALTAALDDSNGAVGFCLACSAALCALLNKPAGSPIFLDLGNLIAGVI